MRGMLNLGESYSKADNLEVFSWFSLDEVDWEFSFETSKSLELNELVHFSMMLEHCDRELLLCSPSVEQ